MLRQNITRTCAEVAKHVRVHKYIPNRLLSTTPPDPMSSSRAQASRRLFLIGIVVPALPWAICIWRALLFPSYATDDSEQGNMPMPTPGGENRGHGPHSECEYPLETITGTNRPRFVADNDGPEGTSRDADTEADNNDADSSNICPVIMENHLLSDPRHRFEVYLREERYWAWLCVAGLGVEFCLALAGAGILLVQLGILR
ncbi:hypothetical protein EDC01DRAFT_747256 [Geopyxis carbonaria]|nr:hypothetical protein EDC01DRAFT_747256 [Geopyxis carbonaria]